jgi:hypothetical protein
MQKKLNKYIPQEITYLFTKISTSLFNVSPRNIWLHALNELQNVENSDKQGYVV